MVTETPGKNVQRNTSERGKGSRQNIEEEMRLVVPSLSRPPHHNNPTTSSPNNSVRLPLATTSHKQRKKRKKKKKTVRHSERKRRRGKSREHRRQKQNERRGKHRRTSRLHISRRQHQQHRGRLKPQDRRPASPSTSRRRLQKGGRMRHGSNSSINSIASISKPQQHLEDVPGTPTRHNNNITAIMRIPHGDPAGIIRPHKTTKSKLVVGQQKTGAPRVYIVESGAPRHRLHHTHYFRDHTSSANNQRVPIPEAEKLIMESMATRYLKTRNYDGRREETRDDDDERQHLGPLTRSQDKSEKLVWSRKWRDSYDTTEDGGRREWQLPNSRRPPVAEKYAEWGIGPLRPS